MKLMSESRRHLEVRGAAVNRTASPVPHCGQLESRYRSRGQRADSMTGSGSNAEERGGSVRFLSHTCARRPSARYPAFTNPLSSPVPGMAVRNRTDPCADEHPRVIIKRQVSAPRKRQGFFFRHCGYRKGVFFFSPRQFSPVSWGTRVGLLHSSIPSRHVRLHGCGTTLTGESPMGKTGRMKRALKLKPDPQPPLKRSPAFEVCPSTLH